MISSTDGTSNKHQQSFMSIQSETSLMFPPTNRVDELTKMHNMRTRYKPTSYTQIGPLARNLNRYTIEGNDRRTMQFTKRPQNKRYYLSLSPFLETMITFLHPRSEFELAN